MREPARRQTDEADTAAGSERPVGGTQSVRRALKVLRLVANAEHGGGTTLADVVRRSGLDRRTAARLLRCLVEEGFLDRDASRRFTVGPEAMLLGSLMPEPTPLLRRCAPALKRIARISGDTVFLLARQGDYMQCIQREEGTSAVRVLITQVGRRMLIGTGASANSVLSLMGDAELAALHAHEKDYSALGLGLAQLRARAAAVRRTGASVVFNRDEYHIAGVSVAFNVAGHGMLAISIGTLGARLGPERLQQMIDLLRGEAAALDRPPRA